MCDLCYKSFIPDYSPYPAFRLALSLLLFLSRDYYAPSTDSTPQNNCAFKGSDFVCWSVHARHLWQETPVPFYIAGSQGHSSLSKLILHFDKCAILSCAQTTDLWLKWQNLAESQKKAENVHSS